jgi:hypothetical protein
MYKTDMGLVVFSGIKGNNFKFRRIVLGVGCKTNTTEQNEKQEPFNRLN